MTVSDRFDDYKDSKLKAELRSKAKYALTIRCSLNAEIRWEIDSI
jgi:hypothetical protein